jgi:hypothetical protein
MQTKMIALHPKSFKFRVPYDPQLSEALNNHRSDYLHNGVSFRRQSKFLQISLNKKQLININPLLKNPQLNQSFKQNLLGVYKHVCPILSIDYLYLHENLTEYHTSIVSSGGSLFSAQRRLEGFHNSQEQLKELNRILQDIIYSFQQLQERYLHNRQRALAKRFQKNIQTIIKMQKIIGHLIMPGSLRNSKHLEKQAKIILQKLTRLRFSVKYLKPFDFIQEALDTEINKDLCVKYDPAPVLSGTQRSPLSSATKAPNAAQNKPLLSDDLPSFLSLAEESDISARQSGPIIAKQPETN